ncbi:hypothetical protein CYLTODRAFT_404642 [Cylindrobasidium torrendii FP15055 ss-10]|uniref:DNA/RNA-binding domain-containing protein n=1 Tax=Cylindrobasidium torrendii FP15055 ss-10 TaxID=1314674 RepID=A0A0D7AYP0_9AGAR|nr:hypothetical protein CYLTODRAFT_404642 [Cylindrobasidium torrendii FP15055 ss-10]
MSDHASPAAIAKEAKSIHQALKEALKTKEPFDRDVEFQRKNLRKRYLLLLLIHPYAKESKDAENHLWMLTSYSFISAFKQRIAQLDRLLNGNNGGGGNNSNNDGHGPVEYRKLVQRFRQFLAEEEKFWTKLVLRFRRSFGLDEAVPMLVQLGLLLSPTDNTDPPADGRNLYQLPEEANSVVPTTPAQRESRLNLVSKALVCLGDLARYREVYNDGGGRSRIGHEDVPRRGRGRRGPAAEIVRPRNYAKARACYEQAKLLLPTDGNPSHQLAILASYENDQFTSLVHYYFALCVKQPYDTASDNMGTIMFKALEQYKSQRRVQKAETLGNPPVAKIGIDRLKERIVVLHAIWRLGFKSGESEMVSLSKDIYAQFRALLADAQLQEEFIPQILVTSQGALWTRRTAREDRKKKSRESTAVPMDPVVVEIRIFQHVLLLQRALLEVGSRELDDAPSTDHLIEPMAVPLRRMLRALRVSFKWVRANIKYIIDHPSGKTTEFWAAMSGFVEALARAFPLERLPGLTAVLEEDQEFQAFLPLKGLLAGQRGGQETTEEHPNVVNLVRVRDILNDAIWIGTFAQSPLNITFASHIKAAEQDDDATDCVEDAFEHLKDQDAMDEGENGMTGAETGLDKYGGEDHGDDDDNVVYPRTSVSPGPPNTTLKTRPPTPQRISSLSPKQSLQALPAAPPHRLTSISPHRRTVISPLRIPPHTGSPLNTTTPLPATSMGTTAADLLSNVLSSRKHRATSLSLGGIPIHPNESNNGTGQVISPIGTNFLGNAISPHHGRSISPVGARSDFVGNGPHTAGLTRVSPMATGFSSATGISPVAPVPAGLAPSPGSGPGLYAPESRTIWSTGHDELMVEAQRPTWPPTIAPATPAYHHQMDSAPVHHLIDPPPTHHPADSSSTRYPPTNHQHLGPASLYGGIDMGLQQHGGLSMQGMQNTYGGPPLPDVGSNRMGVPPPGFRLGDVGLSSGGLPLELGVPMAAVPSMDYQPFMGERHREYTSPPSTYGYPVHGRQSSLSLDPTRQSAFAPPPFSTPVWGQMG